MSLEYELLNETIRNPFPRLGRRSSDTLPREMHTTHKEMILPPFETKLMITTMIKLIILTITR